MYNLENLLKGAQDMAKSVFGKKEEYVISFTKEDDGLWYVDYPNWPFDHHNLLMVDGADKLCELLSYDGKHTKVSVIPSNEFKVLQSHDLNERFALLRQENSLTGGATYQVQLAPFKYDGGPWIWLCPVTLFVLGEYPKYMYVKKLESAQCGLFSLNKCHFLYKCLLSSEPLAEDVVVCRQPWMVQPT